jgi:heme A synthase
LLLVVPIALGVLHQAGAVILLGTAVGAPRTHTEITSMLSFGVGQQGQRSVKHS